jgi:hypothetical protein
VGTVRSPLSTVPSLLSSIRIGLLLFNSEAAWPDFRERLIAAMAHYYRHLAGTLPCWPEDQHVFVNMSELTRDVRQAVSRVYRRFGLQITAEFQRSLEDSYQQSRSYQSGHRYTLEQFGLDEETVVQEFSHAFDYFGFEPAREACGASC